MAANGFRTARLGFAQHARCTSLWKNSGVFVPLAANPVRRVRYDVATATILPRSSIIRMSSQTSGEKDVTTFTTERLGADTSSTDARMRASKVPEGAQLALLYDGDCPLCMKEVNMLRSRSDARGGTLDFVDIAADDYDADAYSVDYETAMGRIHAIRPDGSVIQGVEVFREAYEAVGLGWIYSVTKIPGALWLADKVYDVWADRRLKWTGRESLEAVLNARKDKRTCR